MKIRLSDWPLPADVYLKHQHYPVLSPLLQILRHLDGGVWTAHDHEQEVAYPQPGAPMCAHHSLWALKKDGAPAGALRGVVEEGGLNMPWPDYNVVLVEAHLSDGRSITVQKNIRLWLSGEGFAPADLAEAATAAGLKLRTFPS